MISLAPDAAGITIHARAKRKFVPYPDCGGLSDRIHSRYLRTLADLPWHGTKVRLRVQTRRFFCPARGCERRIFTERLTGTTERYARRTLRLSASLRELALALGGEAGARLSAHLARRVSADTLLRHLHALPTPVAAPRVLAVDDWAYRKGLRYGTILVDLERRCPVDLLPDRTGPTLSAWLRSHPGVEVIARDRSTEYKKAISEAAPGAVQVADRWHLLHNLGQALERYFAGNRSRLKEIVGGNEAGDHSGGMVRGARSRSRREAEVSAARREHRLARYLEVHRLHREEGLGILPIARRLGMSRVTVRKYLSAESFPEWSAHPSMAGILTPYESHLEARWREGCRNALELWREIRQRGFPGTHRQVTRWAQLRRKVPAKTTPKEYRANCLMPSIRRGQGHLPSPRQLAWLLVRDPAALTEGDTQLLERLRLDSEVETIHGLARAFVTMIQLNRPGFTGERVS